MGGGSLKVGIRRLETFCWQVSPSVWPRGKKKSLFWPLAGLVFDPPFSGLRSCWEDLVVRKQAAQTLFTSLWKSVLVLQSCFSCASHSTTQHGRTFCEDKGH